jgi:general secretion pathway protein C
MIAGMAWSVARTVLFFLGDSNTGDSSPVVASGAAEAATAVVDFQAVIQRHLFGEMNASLTPIAAAATVETRLPLELQAVFVAAQTKADSTAIVAEKGSVGRLFRVGGDLPGGATLAEVHADHIVISRGGSRERLNFPRLSAGLAAPMDGTPEPFYDTPADFPPPDMMSEEMPVYPNYEEPIPPDPVPVIPEPAPAESLQDYQARLEADPVGTLDEMGVSAVANDSAQGYRVGDLAHSPHLRQTGLQPGDVIVSVNGNPVGNVESDRAELAGVLAQGSARIEIQRGSRRFFVNTSLEK